MPDQPSNRILARAATRNVAGSKRAVNDTAADFAYQTARILRCAGNRSRGITGDNRACAQTAYQTSGMVLGGGYGAGRMATNHTAGPGHVTDQTSGPLFT